MGLLNAELDTGGVYTPAALSANQINAGRLANERAGLLNRYMQEDRPYQVQSLKDAADKSARENRIGAASEESQVLMAKELARRLKSGEETARYQIETWEKLYSVTGPMISNSQNPDQYNRMRSAFMSGETGMVLGDTPEENAQIWASIIPAYDGPPEKFTDFKNGMLYGSEVFKNTLAKELEGIKHGNVLDEISARGKNVLAEIEARGVEDRKTDEAAAKLGGGRGLSPDDPGYDRIMKRVTDDITASFYDDLGNQRFAIGMPTAYEEQQLKRKLTEAEAVGVTLSPTQALDQMRGYVNGEGEFARGMAEGVITPQLAQEYITSGIWIEEDVNPALDAYMEMAKKVKPDERKVAGELVDAFRDAVKDGKKARQENIADKKAQEARTSYEKEHGPGSYQKKFFDRRRKSLKDPANAAWWGP